MSRVVTGVALCLLMAGASIAPSQAAEKIRIGHAGAQVFRLPLYVAVQNKYFTEEGLDAEVVDTRSGADADMMLAGKAVEFVTAPLIDNINLNKQGIHAVGVAALFNRFNNSIVIPKRLAGEIKSIADLKGRPVGVTAVGSGTWQFASFAAVQAGLKKEDLNMIAVGTAALGAMQSGRVDAMSFADPENYEMVHAGEAVFLIDMADDATHKKFAGNSGLFSHMFTREDVIKEKPAVVQSFVNAIQRSIVWLQAHSEEEVAALITKYPAFERVDVALMVAVLKRSRNAWPENAAITKDAFDNAMKLPVAIGVIDKALPYEQLVDNSFADKAAAKFPVAKK